MTRHGGWIKHRRTYQCWQDMKQRCLNPRHRQYRNYGGRGIAVCSEWRESFKAFFRDMGVKPDGLTLERIDNNGPYTKDNCRWATRSEQRVNCRACHYLERDGKRMTIAEWAREVGRHQTTLRSRLRRGYPLEMVLSGDVFRTGNKTPLAAMKERAP